MVSSGTEVVVFIDIPDPDNILMVRQALRDFPNSTVPIILSPRPVDFCIPRYGKDFRKVQAAVSFRNMLMPLDDKPHDWVYELKEKNRENVQKWFTPDRTFDHVQVQKDTALYMQVSALRFISLLESEGILRSRYQFYWDPRSMKRIQAGLRHAFHVHDFTYDFNEEELSLYSTATEAASGPSDTYGEELRSICAAYVDRKCEELEAGTEIGGKIIADITDFAQIVAPNINRPPLVEVGGPFTEALDFIKEVPVRAVVAMAGFIDGRKNLFPNQFNFHVDVASAKEFLDHTQQNGIPVTLVPTECIKGSPFEVDDAELAACLAGSPELLAMTRRYHTDSGSSPDQCSYKLFDWIAALTVKTPELFPKKRVQFSCVRNEEGTEVITFTQDLKGPIEMCWNDEKHMLSKQELLLQKLRG